MPSTPTHKNLGSVIETPDSGQYELGDKVLQTRIYRGTAAACVAAANTFPKNAAGTGAQAGYIVQKTTVTPSRGGQATLTVVWESAAPQLPPDEVSVRADNQSPRVERHPMFKPLQDLSIGTGLSEEQVLDVIENAVRAQTLKTRREQLNKIKNIPLAQMLVKKIQRGQESYYLAALRYSWTKYYTAVPIMTRGGFSQPAQGPLATYFVNDIDWLREADDLQYANNLWRLTRSWIGAAGFTWDADLYG